MRALLLVGFAFFAAAAHAGEAYLRVDQLGYPAGSAPRAYLATTASASGLRYVVRDQKGNAVFSAAVGPASGTWAAYTVYPLDVPAQPVGSYTIAVPGAAAAPLRVDAPVSLFAGALANALAFYQVQRDGADFIAGALRSAASHLNDSAAAVYATPAVTKSDLIVGDLVPTGETIDADGGWWDAGDYLKFVETHSYTVATLLTGLRDFPGQMGPGGPADFTAEARFGLTWLLRMWNDQSRTLYYQVGNGIDFQHGKLVSDHDLWRLPQTDDTAHPDDPNYAFIRHRPVFAAGPAGAPISPNLAGRLSAAFAMGFLQYRTSDPGRARACLLAAEHIFDLADTHPAKLLTALPYDFYPETAWRDDMEWGATELYLALALGGQAMPPGLPHTDAGAYLAQAAQWAHAYIGSAEDGADTLNLYDVSGLAHFDLIRGIALAGQPPGLAVSVQDLQADLLRQLTGALTQGRRDPFGFGFPWAAYDTTSHGAGLSVMASEYAFLTGQSPWARQADLWRGNILGANIWGLSLLVGDGTDFPKCLQHQVANIAGALDGQAPILAGPAVEGPNATGAIAHGVLTGMRACPADGSDPYRRFTGRGARFRDNQQNYANTEPAIDLTATSPLMFAWRMAGAPRELGK